ncbi:GNAT family N-acetyltransferase [Virgibacillus pantothenticus]|uniref:GNAT family N-acetyltransferase n=1 Tax=Virgibacillus pantothenticus TaxID=1473 RepID=UPI002014BF39|nr:GNAT family protein [Virgibacillus pantothenticus]
MVRRGQRNILDGKNGAKIGLLIIGDISDTIPILLDVRIANNMRGKGYRTKAVNWIADYVFTNFEEKIRIEAYTRHDNIAMRKAFFKSNFVKEGYLRSAWKNADGTISDTVFYAIIRKDWEQQTITPSLLNELPFLYIYTPA